MSHHANALSCILPSNQMSLASSQVSKKFNIQSQPIPSNMKNVTTPIAQVVATPATIVTQVYIVDESGNLYSAKLKEFAEVSKEPKLLSHLPILKHNPTNVYGSGVTRRSDEARRPLYLLSKGKMLKQDMIATPAKVTKTNSAGKQVKVAQSGPRTIYVVAEAGDTRPFSINPEQFEALSKDLTALKYLAKLKHLPTCVELSLTRGLISTDENRPMYRVTGGKLVQHFATEQAPVKNVKDAKIESPEPSKAEAVAKHVGKKNKSERALAKAAIESVTVVDQPITETLETTEA